MKGPQLAPDQRNVIRRWIEVIRPWPHERPDSTDAVARGRALFEEPSIGCANCHSGPTKTNNLSADVATGGVFQIPSLIGVSTRVPLMHNGCAPSLRARFENHACGGGDNHGLTSTLSAEELDDLVAYLKTL